MHGGGGWGAWPVCLGRGSKGLGRGGEGAEGVSAPPDPEQRATEGLSELHAG